MTDEAPLTREEMHGKQLLFYPKTEEEAIALQEKLLDMGIAWSHGPRSVTNVANVLQHGLLVKDDKLYYANNDKSSYTVVSTRRILTDFIPPEKKFLVEQFEKINRRLDALEKRVDEIHEALYPVNDKKPVLKPPSN